MIKYRQAQLGYFWKFLNERHNIYLKKKSGAAFPWTKDKILREYKFTNVFRQLDKVTQAWTERWIKLLFRGKDMKDGDILFHCAMFRLFNWPETYDAIFFAPGSRNWSKKRAIKILEARKAEGKQIFTGAYIVTSSGKSVSKVVTICEALDYLHKHRHAFADEIRAGESMEKACEVLQQVPTVGGFVAYEIACDLRHTRLLADAKDILSWANPGPGARRGVHRLLKGVHTWAGKKPDYIKIMHDLLTQAPKKAHKDVLKGEWPFEMREIEHTLCEFDKWCRVKYGEGRPRSKYRPVIT